MKYVTPVFGAAVGLVTPLAGVRIEISEIRRGHKRASVTPLAGVRIEIVPSRQPRHRDIVTPFTGVRIEMTQGAP